MITASNTIPRLIGTIVATGFIYCVFGIYMLVSVVSIVCIYYAVTYYLGAAYRYFDKALQYEYQYPPKTKLMEENYLKAYKLGCKDGIFTLIDFYSRCTCNRCYYYSVYENYNCNRNCYHNHNLIKAEKYCLMAIDDGQESQIAKLAHIYYNFGYCINSSSLHTYQENLEKAFRYFIMAIDKGVHSSYFQIRDICFRNTRQSNLKLFYELYTNKNKNNKNYKHIQVMVANREIHYFNNKLNMLSKQGFCKKCRCNKTVIPMKCAHFVCPECYIKYTECRSCGF